MRRFIFFLMLPALWLGARDNPFRPVIDTTVLPESTNRPASIPPFQGLSITLPSDARVLKGITLRYQNVEGAVKSVTYELNGSVDWHIPLYLAPRKSSKNGSAKKNMSLRYAPLAFVSLQLKPKAVYIRTKDTKIRAFHLSDPFKIAVDFKRTARFLTCHKTLNTPPYKAVDIGNHGNYYRVVVTFDAPYRYTLQKTPDGYVIRLR